MRNYVQSAKIYVTDHRKEFAIGAKVTVGATVLIALAALFIYTTTPHYTYQPVKACDLLTPTKAQDLLGDRVISVDIKAPVVSGDIATSKCSYTDENTDANKMIVAAIAVRSGINDKGVQQNKTEFATAKSNNTVETVKDLGDSAYFNKVNGQLNILEGRKWIIVNYGIGSTPEANTAEKAVELARKVL
jgi:hypothetical protein